MPSILEASRLSDLVPVADEEATRRLSFHPGYMFLTWEGIKDAPARVPAARPSA